MASLSEFLLTEWKGLAEDVFTWTEQAQIRRAGLDWAEYTDAWATLLGF